MRKYIPYIIIIIGLLVIIKGISGYIDDKEIYRILFSIKTSNKLYYLIFRVIFGSLIIYSGVEKIKQQKSR